jgi:hypothetical protein
MGQKVVAITFQIVADKAGIIAVGDKANSLREERILNVDLFEPDRPLLARNVGKSGQFIDEVTLGHAPHGEGEFGAQRQTMKNRGEREADQGGSKRSTEDHDERMAVEEHAQVATHQDEREEHDRSCQ